MHAASCGMEETADVNAQLEELVGDEKYYSKVGAMRAWLSLGVWTRTGTFSVCKLPLTVSWPWLIPLSTEPSSTRQNEFRWREKVFVSGMVFEAAAAARQGVWSVFYSCIRKLKPCNKRSFPMLKGKDGAFLPSPQAIADRWVEFFVRKSWPAGRRASQLCNVLSLQEEVLRKWLH
jgi:hypothetical protein